MKNSDFEDIPVFPSPEKLLKKYGLRPKKSWGQNFLRDNSISERIASILNARQGDLVVELGSGLGHLTEKIAAQGAGVIAVERDRELAPVLKELFCGNSRIRIIEADAKKLELKKFALEGKRILVAGNLPYHLTTPIIFSLLAQRKYLEKAVIMVQKDVAERITAMPGSKDYGILSVQVRMWAEAKKNFDVSPGSFFPAPGVQSSVLSIKFSDKPVADPGDSDIFIQVVRGLFAKRRKILRNNLKSLNIVPPELVDEVLLKADLNPGDRAEIIPVEGFALLSKTISDL